MCRVKLTKCALHSDDEATGVGEDGFLLRIGRATEKRVNSMLFRRRKGSPPLKYLFFNLEARDYYLVFRCRQSVGVWGEQDKVGLTLARSIHEFEFGLHICEVIVLLSIPLKCMY